MLEIKRRNGRLHLAGTIGGQRVRESTGLSVGNEAAARAYKLKREREIVEGRKKGPTVEEAVKQYLERPEGIGVTAATYCLRFAEDGRWRRKRIGDLDLAEVYRAFSQTNKARETIRREIGAVQAMLNWAGDLHRMSQRFEIKKPPRGEERLRFLEEDEVVAMVKAAPDWFRPLVVALFWTGMRRSEAANLRWGDVRKDHLLVSARKGRKARVRWRTIPIHPTLAKELAKLERKGNEYVFRNEAGRPWVGDVTRISKVWSEVAEKAGVVDCVPHDARRTFASMLLEKDVDLRTIADLLGHAKLDLLMLYAQVRGVRKVESVERLPVLEMEKEEGEDE